MVGAVRRVLEFEGQGLAAIGMWLLRRKHGVPPGSTVATYSKEQTFTLTLFAFAFAVETVVADLLLVSFGVTGWVRYAVLVADLYGLLFVATMAAGSVTRPHVVTADELRIRYGHYFDLRVPRELITSVRTSRNYNETSMVSVKGERLALAVSSQTNVTVELSEPITAVRPLGQRVEITSIRFFADRPETLLAALRDERTASP
ncbi:hypothetical protein AB0I81_57245 [Nonomuraea sp. NPDC050404]|uniref:hypothetical protein n=1 Tax=Nonomuraea sp. NPDC050404 TaxID=3155783 RepID=UPI0033F2C445